MKILGIVLIALFAVLAIPCAIADYMLPRAEEDYFVLAEHWKLDPDGKGGGKLSIDQDHHTYQYDISSMWLADRINSDSICCGSYQKAMTEYLSMLNGRSSLPLCVELATHKSGAPLFVAGIWSYNPKKTFERKASGWPLYGFPPEQLKGMKTDADFDVAVRNRSKDAWKKLSARP